MVSPLLSWFAGNARKLPWRDDPTAYHVWVSEIMLQQTRVEAVKPFYARFIGTLPDVKALAGCPEDQAFEAVGGARLLQPCPKYAKSGTDRGGIIRWQDADGLWDVAFAAGNRKLYSRGGCIDRRRSGSTGSGWERPAGDHAGSAGVEADIAKQSVKARNGRRSLLEVMSGRMRLGVVQSGA